MSFRFDLRTIAIQMVNTATGSYRVFLQPDIGHPMLGVQFLFDSILPWFGSGGTLREGFDFFSGLVIEGNR